MEIYEKLGHRIRQKRNQLGLSQEKLAEACDLTQPFIGSIERGKKKPSVCTIVKIANALNISTDYLLSDSLTNKNNNQFEYTESLMSDMDDYEVECINNTIVQMKKMVYRAKPVNKKIKKEK